MRRCAGWRRQHFCSTISAMQTIRRVAEQYHEAWNRHDPDAIRALFTEEGEILDPSVGAAVRGDSIAAYCRSIFARYPDLVFALVGEPAVSGATIAAQWLARATDRQRGGAAVVGEGAEFLRIQGQQLSAARIYLGAALTERRNPAAGGADEKEPKYRRSGLSADEARLAARRIQVLLEEQHLYRDPDLRLVELAAAVGASTNHISQVINTHFGGSFQKLLARYRVQEAQRLLTAAARAPTSVLAAGLQAGFATKSTFYAAFKQQTRMTPQAWLAEQGAKRGVKGPDL